MEFSTIRRLNRNNYETLRKNPLQEISGSLGDLGTLLPLMIALAVKGSISLSTTLVFTGVWNVLTGIVFGIPLPVQPMKAIAAVAIARSFSIRETISAGFCVSVVVFLFSITGLLKWFTRVIPTPVVKGIQLGAGLSLVLSAGTSLLQPLHWTSPNWADNYIWAILAFLTLLTTQQFQRFPYALIIFSIGLVFSILITPTSTLPNFKIWSPSLYIPTWTDLRVGSLQAGIGQLPLTTLNSVIAVSFLSADLLPNLPAPTVTAMGISVAVMNLAGGWFGAMPVCHGSGGLAAQYRFGARSGASIILLGVVKITLGLFFGEELVGLLGAYPKSLLGVMVLAAGLELAKVGESLNNGARDLWEVVGEEAGLDVDDDVDDERVKKARIPKEEERRRRWTVMLFTVGGLLAFRNDAVGFAMGMLCHWSLKGNDWFEKNSSRWTGGRIKLPRQDESEERNSVLA